MVSACMVFYIPITNSFVFDAMFTTIVRPQPCAHPLQHAGNTIARVQCTEIGIPNRDGHTCIHTYTDAKRDAKQN